MKVRYKGSDAHRRIIGKTDFERIGVTDQDGVIFGVLGNPSEPAELELSEAAGQWLVANDDFEAVQGEAKAQAQEDSSSSSDPEVAGDTETSANSSARGGRSTSRG